MCLLGEKWLWTAVLLLISPVTGKGQVPVSALEIHDVIVNGTGETEECSLFNDCNGL